MYKTRYFVTDVSSIPVIRTTKRGAYKYSVKPGWGMVDWYSKENNYSVPVTRDKEDKSQALYCDGDSSAVFYLMNGKEFVISPDEEINLKDIPRYSEIVAIVTSDSCGFSFWEKEKGNIKIFVTYDENGLVETFRLDNWNGKPYEGEVEIRYEDLQSEEQYEATNRADIFGTFENMRENEAPLFKIISSNVAEATRNDKLDTTQDSQWSEIDISAGDQFYISLNENGLLTLEGRQNGDIVHFTTFDWENGRIDELSDAVGVDIFYKDSALLNGEAVEIDGCGVFYPDIHTRKVVARLTDGRTVDPIELVLRPRVLGDLATVDCGL